MLVVYWNIKKHMLSADLLSDADLDETVATEILKTKILGHAYFWRHGSDWSIRTDLKSDKGWRPGSVWRPIQIHDYGCMCNPDLYKEIEDAIYANETPDEREDRRTSDFFVGHETICLTSVPDYSQDLELALDVVDNIKPCSFSLHHIDNLWIAELNDYKFTYESKMIGNVSDLQVAATVICRAAIKLSRKEYSKPTLLTRIIDWIRK